MSQSISTRPSIKQRLRRLLFILLPQKMGWLFRLWLDRRTTFVEAEIWHLKNWANSEGIAIDAGANNGVYSCVLSQWFRAVEAFEPNAWLIEPVKNAGPSNIHVHLAGLSAEPGEMELCVPLDDRGFEIGGWASMEPNHPMPTQSVVRKKVAVKRLDDYQFANVKLIKIDVEGHEKDVLQGALKTITRDRPVILCEAKMPENRAFLDSFATRCGYRLATLEGVTLVPCLQGAIHYSGSGENFFLLPEETAQTV